MINTTDILDLINDFDDPSKVSLMLKDLNGNIYPVKFNYVADEILFIFGETKENIKTRTCEEFIENLESESQDECWLRYIDGNPYNMDKAELDEKLMNIIISLSLKVYLDEKNNDPIYYFNNNNIVKDIVATSLEDDVLYLIID